MTSISIDLGSEDRTTLTISQPHYFHNNDRIKIDDQSNKYRTRVIQVIDNYSVEIKTFIRPSKGVAKHNRRMKSNEH